MRMISFVLAVSALVPAVIRAESPALVWRPVEVGYDCSAAVTTNQPREGSGSLCLCTRASGEDLDAWLVFVRAELKRGDGQPLGSLSSLTNGSFSVDFFRHPASGDGLPGYSLPWVGIRVRNPDGEEAVLLWESAYNGWRPRDQAEVPEGQWLEDVRVDAGTFWMRYQGRNYNRGKGFQNLAAYAAGAQSSYRDAPSLALGPDTQVVAVEFGSGPNLPGLMLAFIDDVRLDFPGGGTYRYNFEPPPAAPSR